MPEPDTQVQHQNQPASQETAENYLAGAPHGAGETKLEIKNDTAGVLFQGVLNSGDDRIKSFYQVENGSDGKVKILSSNFSKMLHLERERIIEELINESKTVESIRTEAENKKNSAINNLRDVTVNLDGQNVNVITAIDTLHQRFNSAQTAEQKRQISDQISQIYAGLTKEQARALLEYRAVTELLSRIGALEASGQTLLNNLQSHFASGQTVTVEIPTTDGSTQTIQANNVDQFRNLLFLHYLKQGPKWEIGAVINRKNISFNRYVEKALSEISQNLKKDSQEVSGEGPNQTR